MISFLHKNLVQKYRAKSLSRLLDSLLGSTGKVLDIGCGDGQIDYFIQNQKPELHIEGIDVLKRNESFIEVTLFDGKKIPFADNAFDISLLIDVLHHSKQSKELLLEAKRVTSGFIIIKDHIKNGKFSEFLLRMMDRAGNKRYRIDTPFKYLSKSEWDDIFEETGLTVDVCNTQPDIYWFPINYIFGKNLHIITRLKINK